MFADPLASYPHLQPWNSSNRPNRQWPLTAYAQQSSQAVSKSAQDVGSGVRSEPLSTATSIGRKELPAVIAFPFDVSIVPLNFS